MKSIRVSLIVYFLSLLLLGLGGVSLLAYGTAAETLQNNGTKSRLLLEAEYKARSQELRDHLDDHIRKQARQVISRQSRPLYRWTNVLPVLATPMVPLGYLNLAQDMRFGFALGGKYNAVTHSQFHQLYEPRSLEQLVSTIDDWDDDDHTWECCQTYRPDGRIWERTKNIAFKPMTLDEGFRTSAELMQERWDDVPLETKKLRRVTLKVPPIFLNGPTPGPGGTNPQGGKKGPRPSGPFPMTYFLQYAADTAPLVNRLARLAEERDDRIAKVAEETDKTLQDLRRQLFYLCSLAAISVLAGGLVLIWLGLAPLQRFSEAVSRINEKDFQLRLETHSLPSELQPIAERLSLSLDQLRKAFEREKQAAQDISHDLRTPLAALTTTIEVALKKDRSTAEYRELIEECQVSAHQMAHLVERLLALAKIDAGSNPARPRPLDVAQVAHNVADLVRPLAKVREIVLSVHTPDELPMLADGDKLGDVLANLLHNAVDYNRRAGTIDLFVERLDDFVEIRVADTGIGIQPEARERLFERFYRADPSRHSDTPHCGLGLAIVKSYVELMNGSIAVNSKLGEGTTFAIRLPYVGPPANLDAALPVSDPHEVLA